MTRQGPRKYGADTPDILFVIDNDFEQRYYQSPEALAKGIGYLSDEHGILVAYRRIKDEGFDMNAVLAERDRHLAVQQAEFDQIVGPQGGQNTPQGQANWKAWEKREKVLRKQMTEALTRILEKVR